MSLSHQCCGVEANQRLGSELWKITTLCCCNSKQDDEADEFDKGSTQNLNIIRLTPVLCFFTSQILSFSSPLGLVQQYFKLWRRRTLLWWHRCWWFIHKATLSQCLAADIWCWWLVVRQNLNITGSQASLVLYSTYKSALCPAYKKKY